MKKILLFALVAVAGVFSAAAQNYALIDMEYIAKHIPAYEQATKQLAAYTKQYQKEIDAKQQEAKTLYEQYQKAAANLSAQQRNDREAAIVQKEKEASQLKQKYFGPEGEIAAKQKQLIEPLQNRIYEVVKMIAQQRGYALVIDRSSAQSVIFASPSVDISDLVLTNLNISK